MEKNLIVQPEKCTGCRTCETVCSFVHTGEFNPLRSRITVFNFEKVGLGAPMVCQQCSVAACMEVCPVGAINRDEKTGAMIVAHDRCLKCKMCTIACPFGATTYDPIADMIMKCDLCGGDPQCVIFCPSGAISYQDPVEANLAKRKSYAEKFKTVYEEVI
ncbi:MAG: 4Fe-4S dicluster domain-containing protein [Syntrophomonadaceae bacterium]